MDLKCNKDCKNCYDKFCTERKEKPEKNMITNEIIDENLKNTKMILLNE